MEPIQLLDTTFEIINKNNLKLIVRTELLDNNQLCITVKGLSKDNDFVFFNGDCNETILTHFHNLDGEFPTKDDVKSHLNHMWGILNKYIMCNHCQKGYYQIQEFKSNYNNFKCHNCVSQILYNSYNKDNVNMKKCYICDHLTWNHQALVNSCCRTNENEQYICNSCCDNLDLEEDEGQVFVVCPLCRGKLKICE